MKRYLIPGDYYIIRDEIADALTGQDPAMLARAERAAVDQMTDYLHRRYVTESIFFQFEKFEPGKRHAVGDLVYLSPDGPAQAAAPPYLCVAPTNGEPPGDARFWAEFADRNQHVSTHLAYVTLHHLGARGARRGASANFGEKYQEAIEWLERVADGTLTPDLPLRGAGSPALGDRFFLTSHKTDNQRY